MGVVAIPLSGSGTPGPTGPAGPSGPTGPQGPPGSGGGGGSANYTHSQGVPSATWVIVHNFGFKPGGVLVTDSAGSEVIGAITQIDLNTTQIDFSTAFGGFAYLS
jgi:hypothetical protein